MFEQIITKDQAERVAEAAGLEPEAVYLAYSGRGMFGRECFGITTHNLVALGAAVQQVYTELQEEGEQDGLAAWDVQGVLSTARTDNLGRETLVYFPYVKVVGVE